MALCQERALKGRTSVLEMAVLKSWWELCTLVVFIDCAWQSSFSSIPLHLAFHPSSHPSWSPWVTSSSPRSSATTRVVTVSLSLNTALLGGQMSFFAGLFPKTLKLSVPWLNLSYFSPNYCFSSFPFSVSDNPLWYLVLRYVWGNPYCTHIKMVCLLPSLFFSWMEDVSHVDFFLI